MISNLEQTFRWFGPTDPVILAAVESVNIHESIKTASSERDHYIDKYITSIKSLGDSGLQIICYNFMPALDWTRTSLGFLLSNNASALRYHFLAVAAFDLYILERKDTFKEFSPTQQKAAKAYLDGLTASEKTKYRNCDHGWSAGYR